ncbi:MAG: hypothetical protein NTX95_09720 [Actinobacteria bacterium]|jgi:uncharacterized protein YceH (UPF0502 family)|nr:hypothetical protein [Actinomycetota bacterium]
MSDSGTTPKGPRGSIGPETYDAVKKLIDAGMNKTEAFAQVAKETGRSAATVTTTYYRIAKRKPGGGGVRTSAKSAKAATRKAVGGQTDRLAADARAAIDALHQHVAALEAQLEELAQKSQELERIKKALGRI